jgi:hypothetical protein
MKTFLEWLELKEMPLSFYGTHFNTTVDPNFKPSKLGSDGVQGPEGEFANWSTDAFTHRDKVLLSAPKTQRKLFEKLKLSKYNINIIPYENVKTAQKHSYEEAVENFIQANNVQLKDHITFIKRYTTGHMLKPKMILHTLGHAVADFSENRSTHLRVLKFFDMLQEQYGDIAHPNRGNDEIETIDGVFLNFLKILFVFESVQNGRILYESQSELLHELIAEYLWSGDNIRIHPDFRENFKKFYFPNDRDDILDIRIQKIKVIINGISNLIELMLGNCLGKIIYD